MNIETKNLLNHFKSLNSSNMLLTVTTCITKKLTILFHMTIKLTICCRCFLINLNIIKVIHSYYFFTVTQ